jgi:hypothetical protein
MKTAIPDRYIRVQEFDHRAKGIDFPVEVWATAAELTEVRTCEELERITGLDPSMLEDALTRLISRGLVKKHLVSWQDFAKSGQVSVAKDAPDSAPTQEIAETMSELGQLVTHCKISLRLGQVLMPQVSKNLLNARIGQLPSFIEKPLPVAPVTGYLLKTLIDQIASHASDPVAGQLLVYQVFLRVPLKILKAEGISSLRFVDQKTVIKSKLLYDSISGAVQEILGTKLPPFECEVGT